MIRTVRTASGSVYEFEDRNDGMYVLRVTEADPLRRDGEWVKCKGFVGEVRVGEQMKMILEPLGAGMLTIRITNYVTEVNFN